MGQAREDLRDVHVEAPDVFDLATFLASAGPSREILRYEAGATIFAQGDPCHDIRYLQTGAITLSILSRTGKAAVVAILGPGDFFGEGCLAGHAVRLNTATATLASTVLIIAKSEMALLLREQSAFTNRFLSHMLARNIRIQEDLVDQLFNSSEKRLARTLLLLSQTGQPNQVGYVLPKPSQALLAEMIGTTRSRVNFFMNKFRQLGFIEYQARGGLVIHNALLSVVTDD